MDNAMTVLMVFNATFTKINKTVHHGVHFIADNLLKVALNTIKTGDHVIHHN
jgi:hypothetical protein